MSETEGINEKHIVYNLRACNLKTMSKVILQFLWQYQLPMWQWTWMVIIILHEIKAMFESQSKVALQAWNGLASDNHQHDIKAMCVSLSEICQKAELVWLWIVTRGIS